MFPPAFPLDARHCDMSNTSGTNGFGSRYGATVPPHHSGHRLPITSLTTPRRVSQCPPQHGRPRGNSAINFGPHDAEITANSRASPDRPVTDSIAVPERMGQSRHEGNRLTISADHESVESPAPLSPQELCTDARTLLATRTITGIARLSEYAYASASQPIGEGSGRAPCITHPHGDPPGNSATPTVSPANPEIVVGPILRRLGTQAPSPTTPRDWFCANRPPLLPEPSPQPVYIRSWTSDEILVFWGPSSIFSQWHMWGFDHDGVRYNCAEQFLASKPARIVGDIATQQQRMTSLEQAAQKVPR